MKHAEIIKEVLDAEEGKLPELQYKLANSVVWGQLSAPLSSKQVVVLWLVSHIAQQSKVRKKPIPIPDKVYFDVVYFGESAFKRLARRVKFTVKTDENGVVTETVEFA